MAENLHFVVIDTMTSSEFSGNPTPVFILDHLKEWLPDKSMQLIARELNHSETCFVRQSRAPSQKQISYDIRWFTPSAEEPFCGHGILGSAQALHAVYGHTELLFSTYTGIKASATILTPNPNNRRITSISMNFPSESILPTIKISEVVQAEFSKALGIASEQILAIGQNSLIDIIIEVDPGLDFSAANMNINPEALLKASPPGIRSQVITSSWSFDKKVDFAKRVFAYGGEDQATGSTYCALVPYWATKLGKSQLRALQPSFRGGEANVELTAEGVVEVIANCVKTMDGHIVIPSVEAAMIRAKL